MKSTVYVAKVHSLRIRKKPYLLVLPVSLLYKLDDNLHRSDCILIIDLTRRVYALFDIYRCEKDSRLCRSKLAQSDGSSICLVTQYLHT